MSRSLRKRALVVVAILLAGSFAIFHMPLRLGLDLRGGASLILRVKIDNASAVQQREVMEQTRQILQRRINAYGLAETPIQPYGSRGNELLVQLPGINDSSRVRNLLQSRSVLEWYSVSDGPFTNQTEAMAQHGGVLSYGSKLLGTRPAPDGRQEWYVVTGAPVIRGTDLRDARVVSGNPSGNNEQPATRFTLSQDAAARFARFTQANINKRSAIVLDHEILSAPVIQDVIRDSGLISGARSVQEAEDLAVNLRSGALPAAIDIVQEHTVEASLGTDSIRDGIRAGAVGLATVVAFMVFYYRGAGANATLSLLLNGLLLIAALAGLDAVLTLPGIAGIVLTIGMAVDSNVLIFERIREEMRAGRTPAAALSNGFSKAFATLIDTHVTTVVSCAFLFFFGTPAVKGFAATLVIGLMTNLFTSVFVSRVAFDWEMSRQQSDSGLSMGLAPTPAQ